MTLHDIFSQCKELSVFEERSLTDNYYEIVYYTREMPRIEQIFTGLFGIAAKPAGAKPSREDAKLAEEFGGVWGNQTLYKKTYDTMTVIAMFWPWQDNTHLTVKMARIPQGV